MTCFIIFVLCLVGYGETIDLGADKDSVKAELIRCLEEGDYYKTVGFAEAAAEFYRHHDDKTDLAGCYMTLGNAHQRMGHYEEAVRCYNLCSATMDEIGGPMAKVNKRYVHNNMAAMYLEMGEYGLAEDLWNQCIASVNSDDPGFLPHYNQDSLRCLDLATYYQNLAEVRLEQALLEKEKKLERTDEAIRFLEQSIDFSERYSAEPTKIVGRLMGLAKAYFEAGRTADATLKAKAAMQMAIDLDDKYMITALHLLEGEMELRQGRTETAEHHYLEAFGMARENHFGEFEMDALRGAYECTKVHHPARALTYFTENAALKDSIYNKEQQALVRDYEVKYKMEEKEHELAMQQEKNRQGRRLLVLSLTVAALLLVLLLIGVQIGIKRKQRNALKDHLLFIVAHDIKAPVISQSQLLDITCKHFDIMPKEEMKENLEALKVSADDMRNKLQNIIYWVKGELGGYEAQQVVFGLSQLTMDVMQDLALQIDMKGLKVLNEIPHDWQGLDDVNAVRMAMQNLLSNAVKYSWPNGEIHITAKEDNGRYWISVSDNGLGIGKEKMERLLKGFVAHTDGTAGEMGTGIGLFVTRQLMDRKGGKIKMESQVGKGTTVSFTVNKA